MWIMTANLSKVKAVAGVAAGCILLCALVFASGQLHQSSAKTPPAPENISGNEDRVRYLSEWGWEVNPSAVETLDLVLPETLSDSYRSYNTLQAENQLDLAPYCGQRVKRYTYTVLNYPGQPEGVQANLYLSGDTVIAGDILSTGADGFISNLQYPG